MSFRFSKIPRSYGRICPTSIVSDVVQTVKLDKSGVERVAFVHRPNDVVTKSIPKPSEYSLENLLAAGVPLSPVNASILDSDVSPSEEQIEKFVDSLESSTNDLNK